MLATDEAPIVGNSTAIQLLRSAIVRSRVANAYLFTGKSGIGKQTTARWFARAILESDLIPHPDILEIEPTVIHEGKLFSISEAAQRKLPVKRAQIRIEQIRQLSADIPQRPIYGKRRIAIVDQAETMSEAAAHALLKTLEESKATIILIANDIGAILPTIISRCQVVPFYPLSETELETVLQRVCSVAWNPSIVAFAQGSPGKAIRACEQLKRLNQFDISILPTSTVLECLQSAQQMKELERSLQGWLLDWWQFQLWQTTHDAIMLDTLETTRTYLSHYCQPQLVWETCFLKLRKLQPQWETPVLPMENASSTELLREAIEQVIHLEEVRPTELVEVTTQKTAAPKQKSEAKRKVMKQTSLFG